MKELFPEKTGVSTSVKVIGSSQKRVMRKFTSNGKTSVASTSSKPTKRQSVSPPAVATGSTDAVSKGKGRAAFVTKTNPGNRKGTVSSKVIVGVKETSAVTTSLKRTKARFAPLSAASGAPGAVLGMNSCAIDVSKSKDRNNFVAGGMKSKKLCCHICEVYSCFCLMITKQTII